MSFHLMPLYGFPDLLDDVSPELRKRMQGKSCFNFVATNDVPSGELATLTRHGYNLFAQHGLLDSADG